MAQDQKRSLFEVAVLHRDPKDGTTTQVIEPTTALAKSAKTAELAVIRNVPAEYDEKLDELEVIVRPF